MNNYKVQCQEDGHHPVANSRKIYFNRLSYTKKQWKWTEFDRSILGMQHLLVTISWFWENQLSLTRIIHNCCYLSTQPQWLQY